MSVNPNPNRFQRAVGGVAKAWLDVQADQEFERQQKKYGLRVPQDKALEHPKLKRLAKDTIELSHWVEREISEKLENEDLQLFQELNTRISHRAKRGFFRRREYKISAEIDPSGNLVQAQAVTSDTSLGSRKKRDSLKLTRSETGETHLQRSKNKVAYSNEVLRHSVDLTLDEQNEIAHSWIRVV